jgi:hypothetical protein
MWKMGMKVRRLVGDGLDPVDQLVALDNASGPKEARIKSKNARDGSGTRAKRGKPRNQDKKLRIP